MLEAMRTAPLGDDVFGEDPTVQRLERMAAEKFDKEAALLVVSGTMGNLVSLMAHANPGDEVIVDREGHIFHYEAGSMAAVAGLMPMPLQNHGGLLDPDEVAAAIRRPNLHFPTPRLLCLENTHNRGGGRIIPLDLHKELCSTARNRGLAVHLDGARIFNAAVATGIPASAWAAEVDSVMFCLSKGLSCPVGSVIVGSSEFIAKARRCRKRIGGGMRQAGVIAACGIVALETMIDRLADDHANARLLAQGISEIPGLYVDLDRVETNMVYVDHSALAVTNDDFVAKLRTAGVLAIGTSPRHVRLVVNRHHDHAIIAEAVARIQTAVA